MLKLIFRWGPAVLLMSFIFFMSAQPKDSTLMPDYGMYDLIVKKGAHLMCYALLALSFVRGLCSDRPARRVDYVFALLLTVLYAISDEYHQTFVPGREGRWQDVLIDTTGASVALAALYAWKAHTAQSRPAPSSLSRD